MEIRQFDLWLADLNPRMGSEPGKVRPVVVVQSDLLNGFHPSIVVCPLTSRVVPEVEWLRVHLPAGVEGLVYASDVLVDQIRALDRRRLLEKLGVLPSELRSGLRARWELLMR